MGYRSDVAMRIEFDTEELLKQNLEVLHQALITVNATDMFDDDNIRIHGKELTIVYYDVKWYEGNFDDVDTIMAWFSALEEATNIKSAGIKGTQYIRIGENLDDFEERSEGFLYNYMYISRAIEL